MTDVETEARLAALNVYHRVAVSLLTELDQDSRDGRMVRRWAQRCKWLIVDGLDPNGYEVWQACQQAVTRMFHPERLLEERGFVLPGLAVAR